MKISNNSDNALMVKKSLSDKQILILYFYIYSLAGWIIETIYAFCLSGGFVKRGFLFGPMCPIYGFRSNNYAFIY